LFLNHQLQLIQNFILIFY